MIDQTEPAEERSLSDRGRRLRTCGESRDADRAALIGRLCARDDARWLAEVLIDLEGEEGEPARLGLADSLRQTLG